jgi:uncharacterized protein (TIGR02391 family)
MVIQSEISEELWIIIQAHYQNGDYTSSIRDAFIYLSNIIRDKSDLSGDGTDLVNKAFSESNPKIKINKLETTSEVDEQKGIANILRGLYQYIRNPRSHDRYEDTENDCISILLFIDLIIKSIKGSTGQFELDRFIEQVVDKSFVKSEEYCDALISEIPDRKLMDTVLEIYSNKSSIEIYNLQMLFKSFYKRLKKTNIDSFLKIISNDLRKTVSDNDIKYIIKIINPEMWEQIDSIAKIRIENKIIEAIKECTPIGTWYTDIFLNFKNKNELIEAIGLLIYSDKKNSVEYFYKYYFTKIIPLIKRENIYINDIEKNEIDIDPYFIVNIRKKIMRGEKTHYNGIKQMNYHLPDYLKKFYLKALQEFKEVIIDENSNNNFDDDIPF